jgi:hypothetical protein
MYKFLLVALLTLSSIQGSTCQPSSTANGPASSAAPPQHTNPRHLIVNGDTVTSPNDYQFFVRSWADSVRQTPDLLCGASLIHQDIILTAAHCQGAFNYGAMLFNPFTESFTWYSTVDLQIAYPDYYRDIQLINGDVMILRLSEPVTNLVPVQLNSDPDLPFPEQDVAHATGFGLTDFDGAIADSLQVGYFHAISNAECLRRGRFVNVVISDDVMCVDPVSDDSVCGGDSGGPLTVPLVQAEEQQTGGLVGSLIGGGGGGGDGAGSGAAALQVGIISFGTDCVADTIPDGMTRVSFFYDWITEQVCRHSRNPPTNCPSEYLSTSPEEAFIFQDAVEVQLDFHHDFLAEQTTFAVRNTQTDEIEYVGPQYVPRRGDQVSSVFRLFPGTYTFEVHDAGGDGLRNPDYVSADYPQGSWTLLAVYSNGGGATTVVASGDENFEFVQTTVFTVPGEAPPTDTSLTQAPTAAPTVAPSGSPSGAPSAASTSTTTLGPVDDQPEDVGDFISDSNITGNGDDRVGSATDVGDGNDNSDAAIVVLSWCLWSAISFCALQLI